LFPFFLVPKIVELMCFVFPNISNIPPPLQPLSDMARFREVFKLSKRLVVLTGAGISAESGVPTFRGPGGYWRQWRAQELANPDAFSANPSRVWEFYHYRRELMATRKPNAAHRALASCEERLHAQGCHLAVVTQNIDELHHRAGSKNILELHGKERCFLLHSGIFNLDSHALHLSCRAPSPDNEDAGIDVEDLPRCQLRGCGGLLRPHVVWFGESLDEEIMNKVFEELDACDLCLVVGTSSLVYPAAMLAPQVASRGVPVAEFNLEATPATTRFGFHFEGPCGQTLPVALAPFE
uniref:NAD-dependent protein deacylase sirtuin-5, mitochondrial n=1 Tax=Eptatretus burgeri TaxID=7764 RepID=A0A8C4R6E8_EPTBU